MLQNEGWIHKGMCVGCGKRWVVVGTKRLNRGGGGCLTVLVDGCSYGVSFLDRCYLGSRRLPFRFLASFLLSRHVHLQLSMSGFVISPHLSLPMLSWFLDGIRPPIYSYRTLGHLVSLPTLQCPVCIHRLSVLVFYSHNTCRIGVPISYPTNVPPLLNCSTKSPLLRADSHQFPPLCTENHA